VKGILLGFILVGVCALIHATSMVVIGEWLIRRLKKIVVVARFEHASIISARLDDRSGLPLPSAVRLASPGALFS
jgi:hypothetical protein